jgi:hypothetical protein
MLCDLTTGDRRRSGKVRTGDSVRLAGRWEWRGRDWEDAGSLVWGSYWGRFLLVWVL